MKSSKNSKNCASHDYNKEIRSIIATQEGILEQLSKEDPTWKINSSRHALQLNNSRLFEFFQKWGKDPETCKECKRAIEENSRDFYSFLKFMRSKVEEYSNEIRK